MLKPLKNEWTVHSSRLVRDLYRDGRLHALCGHPREDCPWPGNIPNQVGQGQWRPNRSTETVSKTMRRRAWLAGWDKQTELMKKAAEDASRRPAIDEDDV